MKIYRIAKKKAPKISNNDIKSLSVARDSIKKVSLSLRKSGVHTNITSIGFDLDEEIYKLTNN